MAVTLPLQFFFRFELACRYRPLAPGVDQHPAPLGPEYRLPYPGQLDHRVPFVDVRMAWNEAGLALCALVQGKKEPVFGDPHHLTDSDGMTLWLDMRDHRSGHRATRYCHRFLFSPSDGQSPSKPGARRLPIHRALEEPPPIDESLIKIAVHPINREGEVIESQSARQKPLLDHQLEVFLPKETLPGYDPETSRRLGLCYRLRDREKGDQFLAAGEEFPFWEDPSLWSVLALKSDVDRTDESATSRPKTMKKTRERSTRRKTGSS